MTPRVFPRDLVAHELSISPCLLARYEALGVSRGVPFGAEGGYERTRIRRRWPVVKFRRDLGINKAGVEVILQLHIRLLEVYFHVLDLAEQLREPIETDSSLPTTDSYE